jgi:opacity protein-like surface antigen
MLKRAVIIACVLLYTGSCFALTAGNTSDIKIPYGPGIANLQESGIGPIKAGFDAEFVFDRDLDGESGVSSAESEGQKYLLRIGYTISDRMEPYIKLGTSHLKASWNQNGVQAKAKAENGFAFGIGGKALLFDIPEHRIRFSVDGQYLYTDPDIKDVHIDGSNRTISASEFKVSEWQVAGILSMEFLINDSSNNPATPYSLIPYLGLAYTDSKTGVKFTSDNVNYDLGDASSKNKFVFLTGCDITAPENISLNVEGKWIGETAASGGCTLKF